MSPRGLRGKIDWLNDEQPGLLCLRDQAAVRLHQDGLGRDPGQLLDDEGRGAQHAARVDHS